MTKRKLLRQRKELIQALSETYNIEVMKLLQEELDEIDELLVAFK